MSDIHHHVAQLTRPHTHRETWIERDGGQIHPRIHAVHVPSLIDQLANPTRHTTVDGGGGGYESRPAAAIEALDTLLLIDQSAARWVRQLGDDDPGTTAACVARLHALWASQDTDTQARIEADVRRWHTQARIASGWDSPAWRPDNTCPACETRRSLRVNRDDLAAFCVECRETWDPTQVGLLAEHIRWENNDTDNDTDDSADEVTA